jgi:hypothetical protein
VNQNDLAHAYAEGVGERRRDAAYSRVAATVHLYRPACGLFEGVPSSWAYRPSARLDDPGHEDQQLGANDYFNDGLRSDTP